MRIPRIEQLKRDPVLLEYVKHAVYCEKTGEPITTLTPIHALGEKRALVFELLADGFPQMAPDAAAAFALWIYNATVLLIQQDVYALFYELCKKVREAYAAAGDRKPAPKHLPFDLIWLTSTHGWDGSTIARPGRTYDGILLHATQDTPGENNPDAYHVSAGSREVVPGYLTQSYRDALAIFLEQKVASVRTLQPNRQFRKEAKRLGLPHEEAVRVLTLRRIERAGITLGAQETREYHCRWLVSGHLRNQWFPSRQQHELVWIDVYEKGPDGAPFKETVVHLNR